MTLDLVSFDCKTRTAYDDVRRALLSLDGVTNITVTDDLPSESLVLRFEVLGRPEELRFTHRILTAPQAVAQAVWRLREQRLAAVGPEFHMATQLAARNFANVDPYGRPA